MKKSYWAGAVSCLALLIAFAAADSSGFSGRWKANLSKCSFEEIAPETYPETVLDIKLEGTNLSIRQTSTTMRGDKVSERRYTTDGKEGLNAGEGVQDLKGVCRLENGRLLISGELEGTMATVAAGGSEPASFEYFRYPFEEEYTLSPDGKELTIIKKMDFNGKKTITLVFERV